MQIWGLVNMLVVDVRRHEIHELKRVLYFLLYDLKDQPTRSAKQYLVVHKRDSDILYELIYLQLVIRIKNISATA